MSCWKTHLKRIVGQENNVKPSSFWSPCLFHSLCQEMTVTSQSNKSVVTKRGCSSMSPRMTILGTHSVPVLRCSKEEVARVLGSGRGEFCQGPRTTFLLRTLPAHSHVLQLFSLPHAVLWEWIVNFFKSFQILHKWRKNGWSGEDYYQYLNLKRKSEGWWLWRWLSC